jgi:hypothetical protein
VSSASAGAVHSVRQYLERHAAREVDWAAAISERYRAALVVPAYLEAPGLLERYRLALESAPGRVLVIVVVNAAQANAESSWPVHRDLIADLRGNSLFSLGSEQGWLARQACADVLVIDRAHPERCLPDGQGVGLARRIGCDLALALYARGQLEDPFIYCTDADAELPAGYFGVGLEQPDAAGLLFSFWHEPGSDADIDAATAVYELGLRYYVHGLASAGSPFAYHSIGSTLAVQANAYAAVRGFPKRLAGEDFYLLNKLAKVGALRRVDALNVRLASRASLRTPHGTGVRAVELASLAQLDSAPFYHPEIFPLLGLWLAALGEFARTRRLSLVRAELVRRAGSAAPALEAVLDELAVWPALEQAARHCHGEAALAIRLHTWFDAFRTLKFVHALRARGWSSVPFRQALQASEWFSAERARHAPVNELRRLFLEREATRSEWLGIAPQRGSFVTPRNDALQRFAAKS